MVLLTDTFLPHAGGSRFYYFNLFKRVAEMGNDVTVLTSKVEGWQEFDACEQTNFFKIRRRGRPMPNHRYIHLPKIAGPLLTAGAFSFLQRPSIIHCGDLYPPGLVGVILKKVVGLPFVAYSHGEDITLTDQRRFQPKVRDLIYRMADAVIANGNFAVENLLRSGVPPNKIHKITPGVDSSVFYPEAPDMELRQRYGITDEVVLMTVARLVPRKGQDRVIRALATLCSDVPSVKYVIGGRGPEEARLRALTAELNLQDKVVFAGFVPGDQLNRHYNLADVVVMPTREEAGDVEGFGMVFLEANAAGKPVIGGRSGGSAEAVVDGETGFLVDPNDDQELRLALNKLITDSQLRRSFGLNGMRRARAEFDWESRAVALRKLSYDIAAAHERSAK
jgi:phosphatidylinositol alpha-1,6-mannosyltransferase